MATTKDNGFLKSFDVMENGFQAGFDAGRKAQKVWFDAFNGMFKTPTGFEKAFPGTERFTGEFVPMMVKTTETFTDCVDRQVKTNMNAMRRVAEAGFADGEQDIYATTRTFWDTTFGAARDNFEAMTNATRTSWENFNQFCQMAGACGETKAAPKAGK